MVVRQQAALPKHYIYNAAFIAAFVVGSAIAFRSSFQTEHIPGCTERAVMSAPLPVTRSGSRVSLVDLRARSSGAEWGLDDNLRFSRADTDQEPVMTAVFRAGEKSMFKGQRRHLDIESRTSGFGFEWEADVLDARKVGCLSFAVKMPKSLPETSAGVLPGLVVTERSRGADATTVTGHKLAFPMRWKPGGRMAVRLQRSNGVPGRDYALDGGNAVFTPGQWHEIQQEITLSTPGLANGQVRIWVDGNLALHLQGLRFYESQAPLKFDHVAAHVHFADRHAVWQPAPAANGISVRGLTLHGF